MARLQKRLERGEVKLECNGPSGFLRSVLRELDVAVSSQTLVFSKTSFQFRKISPRKPRALYFNDDVYVGWVSEGKLEIISFDPMQGAIFYILENGPADKAAFRRAELDCTQCHVAAATRGVPGTFLRSVHVSPTGTLSGKGASYLTGQESPFAQRFGGWYVTGRHGQQRHMGNVTGANLTSLTDQIDLGQYLSPYSDIVAQMVQAHQTQMHNLITLVNYRTRLALHAGPLSEETRKQYEEPAEELIQYMLFANETPFEDPVESSNSYARDFAARGLRDERGRSLRDFDLRSRLFRYPCSYLLYSEAFDSIPEPAKAYIYRRLYEVLTGHDQSPPFARLSAADRRNILEILLATKQGLPTRWTASAVAASARLQSTVPERKNQ